ncbi:3'-5' exonuclease [Abyssogena phaseoliformis symbiont]|uniref:3'-5' exonuclease n=1 Tax=Abyssogena phaseoliformis symbiont TaxID=596095 RepID=UPI001FDA3C51|nr:3'-5' exonuclease [Abyssogena phaseoliformis symbiont]
MGGNISWLGTPRLLRTHYEKAGLTSGFKILDAQDQFRIDKSKFPIRKVQWFINNQKDEGIRVQDVDPGYNYFIKKSLEVFELYETHYQANDLIDFAPIEIIRLEQNYRSTANILNASNALIAHNANRMGKSLWTDAGNGELIDVYEAQTETDEVDYVTSSIQKLITDGASPSDCSILYRSNAQSRIFKEALIKYNIPYIIYGSLRFFEHSEIKDALGYLRLIENSADNVAFERVVNFQTRSIGNATVEKIRTFTQDNHTSLFQAAIQISSTLPTLAANVLNGFTNLIEQMTDDTKHLDLSEKVANLLNTSGLMMHYSNDKTDKAGSKKENLEELITAAQPYNHTTMNKIAR